MRTASAGGGRKVPEMDGVMATPQCEYYACLVPGEKRMGKTLGVCFWGDCR